MLTDMHQQFYHDNGYVVVEGLFSPTEVAHFLDHFMYLRQFPQPGDDTGVVVDPNDPIKRYPRMLRPHLWDDLSLRWMLEPRLNDCLIGLLGNEPYAAQTMMYFKPPGARGQALHQDNYYLRVRPGTCMAAWLALDDCDEDNGCLQVVAGSHLWDILCTIDADTTISFTSVTVPLPEGIQPEPVRRKAGDVMFFNGSIVHGSFPNTTPDRFRRSLIAHYVEGIADEVAKGYQPLWRMDGSRLELDSSEIEGSVCGVWVEKGGESAIEMVGQELLVRRGGE